METAFLNQGASVDKGENARLSSFVGAISIADLVKSTLGPKGQDIILQSISPDNNAGISVTNDGATILKSIHIDNPAAKVLVDIAKIQDSEIGDGTTSVPVLCGELLREAEQLVAQRIHPQTIAAGWRMARQVARDALQKAATDNSTIEAIFRSDLLNIAKTTLSSKLLTHDKNHFASLAVDAVLRIKETGDLDLIQVIKKPGGSMTNSFLSDGFLLDKTVGVGQPKLVKKAKILIANTSLDTDKVKVWGSRVKVDSLNKVAEIEKAEKARMKQKCEKIIAHGCNVFINRQLIYNFPESVFAENGIMAIEHADFEGVEQLAAVTGGEVVSTFDHPELVALGECEVIEEIMIGEDRVLRFGGCKSGAACTIVLRGASSQMLDEAERSLHDALCILASTLKEPRTVSGGGCCEILMAQAVDRAAEKTPGKKALAMAAFARALRQIPAIIADNGGYDSAELVTQLRAAHAQGKSTHGLDMYHGTVADMSTLGVTESFRSKLHVLLSASEAAEMILRVDVLLSSSPRKREEMF